MTETLVRPADHDVAEPAVRLAISDLAIDFGSRRPAVESVSLTLAAGEILALVGESGSGKSMTARAVLGLLPTHARVSGRIDYGGRDLLRLSDAELAGVRGSGIAMVFQEPQTALNPVRTIGWQLVEVLRTHRRTSRAEARARAVELLELVDIPDAARRLGSYPHQLSGGQKQRVVLALALAGEPDVLLADEPTTALDVTVQHEILHLLRRIRSDLGTSIVLITHNMGVVAEIADRVVVMRAGQVLETRPTADLFADPGHAYTRRLLDSVLELPPREAAPESPPAAPDPARAPALAPAGAPAVLEYRDVQVHFGSRRHSVRAVDGVSLSVAPGEVVGLVGESGSGKTTLGRLAVGLAPLSGGSVHVDGVEVSAARTRAQRGSVAIVHQDPASSLDPRWSIGRSIAEPLEILGVGDAASRRARVAELLDAVQLPADHARRRPHELSGGQRQRVALARALVNRPRLVVADEPTSALDVSVQAAVLDLFRTLQRDLGFACLFISHDLAVVHEVSDRVVVLRSGRVVEQGPVRQVLTAPRHPYTAALVDAVPRAAPRRDLASG